MGSLWQMFAVLGLLFTFSVSFGAAQSAQVPSTPPHSGKAAGQNGPTADKPAPPPRATSNPVTDDNSAKRTFTGTVSDSFCGRHHYMLSGANDAECTRYCIAHRGTYALVVGDNVYQLRNQPGHVLDALAGKRARVTGAIANGNVLEIDSVSPVQ